VKTLDEYLQLAAVAHGHLCAGQVLGVRLAMLGLRELGITDPIAERKRIVTYVEIDRCMTDAIGLVANCRLGKRALKFRDWGKVAATFVDLQTGRAIRIAARESSKEIARNIFPDMTKELISRAKCCRAAALCVERAPAKRITPSSKPNPAFELLWPLSCIAL
jgi:formylmethanofuran dehydrogenase subunit E